MTGEVLPYDPGELPSRAAPIPGDVIEVDVEGWPPWKDTHFSIRNSRHRIHSRFVSLRAAAIQAMNGRAWYHGPIGLQFRVYGPHLGPHRVLIDYLSGIMDTLDGSHGATFTYLPAAYEDDSQVVQNSMEFIESDTPHYSLRIEFLPNEVPGR